MILRIDTTSSIPVYAQIVDQVKRAMASGTLKSGDALPSLRELSVKLRINPLTVGKAYKILEQEGLVETRHGLGSYISDNGQTPTEIYRRESLSRTIDNLLIDAHNMGVSPDELKQLIEERIEAVNDSLIKDNLEEVDKDDR